MKRALLILGLFTFALVLAGALFGVANSKSRCSTNTENLGIAGSARTTPAPPLELIPIQPDWEGVSNIPLYPGAQEAQDRLEPQHTMRYVAFETSDAFEKVEAFYKAYLPEYGWACVDEEGFPTYEWTDTNGQVPWRLRLVIAYEILLNYKTEVELHIYRYPHTAKIALYPGAQQREVKSIEPQSMADHDKTLRVTTYATEAKPKDIESYYKSVLKEHAWLFDDKKSVSIVQEPGLIFHHWYGTTMGGPRGAHVYIVAKADNPGADQFTKVEILLEEYGVAK